MRPAWLVALLLAGACGDDTTSAAVNDLAVCLQGTSAPPCPACLPRSGDPCSFELIVEGRGCVYPTPSPTPIVCLCGGEATFSCGPPIVPPHD